MGLGGACILLIDDNANNGEVALDFLAAIHVQVDVAMHGDTVRTVRMVPEHDYDYDYDLVLMDIAMPGIDRFAATRKMRALRNRDNVPIYHDAPTWDVTLAPGATAVRVRPLAASGNWYDLSLHVRQLPAFVRRLAVRQETGRDSVSDPAMGASGKAPGARASPCSAIMTPCSMFWPSIDAILPERHPASL